jgi:lipoprotein NlpD
MDKVCRIAFAPALAVALVLSGCASTGEAPVEDHSINASPRPRPVQSAPVKPAVVAQGTYRVQRGDTLYSIAFRHGVDYRDLAQWNSIEPPYTIYPGRELRMSPREGASKRVAAAAPPPVVGSQVSRPPTTAPRSAPANAASSPTPFEPVAAAPSSSSAQSTNEATTSTAPATPPPPSTAQPPKPSQPVVPPEAVTATNGDIAWRWPADGQVIGTYNAGDPTKQGIDIAGAAGAPVRAAADGTVVYSGNGLIGYGELIIVKHNPSFLSAYGHNRKRLVQEGDRVKAGQTIAEMGSSGASRDELHFEIRKNGKPSNPLDYLPHR